MGTAIGNSIGGRRCAWRPTWLAMTACVMLVGPAKMLLAQQSPTVPPRHFAPGVVTTVPPDFLPDDTVSTHDIVEIRANKALEWTPELVFSPSRTLYGMSSDVKFRR